MEAYAEKMREALEGFLADGVRTAVFGDLFLEEVRRTREENLAQVGMAALFPLWGRDTTKLARDFVDLGFRAVVTSVDTQALDASFAGRAIDADFLRDLPAGVDPCGENGEFHSFVFDGPVFARPVPCRAGKRVTRDRFVYCELLSD